MLGNFLSSLHKAQIKIRNVFKKACDKKKFT